MILWAKMILLHKPQIQLFPSYMQFIVEMQKLGEVIWEDLIPKGPETPEIFINRLIRSQTKPEPNRVAESTYWAVIGDDVVGRICLRHELNAQLREFGGHIGYEVRPTFRRKGLTKEMLRNLLTAPETKSIGRILITCAPDNIASNKTILANGGKLTEKRYVERFKRDTNYYWIDVGHE